MPGVSETFNDCNFKELWNAWQCTNDNLGLLMFIGDDKDWEDRDVAPVYVKNKDRDYNNKLNHQMDHRLDASVRSPKHKSQFQAMIDTEGNYTIDFNSAPNNNMRFEMRAPSGNIKVKIDYWSSGSYEVYANGEKVEHNEWDERLGTQKELLGEYGCGENRYVGVVNFLEFILTPYCLIEIKPVTAVITNVRMAWTMEEFYDNGGVTSFIDRISTKLNIHTS